MDDVNQSDANANDLSVGGVIGALTQLATAGAQAYSAANGGTVPPPLQAAPVKPAAKQGASFGGVPGWLWAVGGLLLAGVLWLVMRKNR